MLNKPFACMFVLAVVVAATMPAVASAQDAAALLQADRNGDGAVSRDEARTALLARFAALDADGDGAISRSEYVDHALSRLFRLDGDGDGQLTRAEMRASLRPMRQR